MLFKLFLMKTPFPPVLGWKVILQGNMHDVEAIAGVLRVKSVKHTHDLTENNTVILPFFYEILGLSSLIVSRGKYDCEAAGHDSLETP